MHALSPRRLPLELDHTAEIVSFAELNRARSRRVLDQAQDEGRTEERPWAYCFPRPAPTERGR